MQYLNRQLSQDKITNTSSQICSYCGASTGKKPLNIRKFDCPHCAKKDIDRDINASINMKQEAQFSLGVG